MFSLLKGQAHKPNLGWSAREVLVMGEIGLEALHHLAVRESPRIKTPSPLRSHSQVPRTGPLLLLGSVQSHDSRGVGPLTFTRLLLADLTMFSRL